MRNPLFLFAAMTCVFFVQSAQASAQVPEKDAKASETKPADKCAAAATKEESSVTDHTLRIGAQTIPYKATASTTLLKNDKGDPTGLLYSVAYTRTDVKDMSLRPVSFLYNGGPGSATMWLHMGAFGPRRAHTVDGVFTPPAPYKLVDNTQARVVYVSAGLGMGIHWGTNPLEKDVAILDGWLLKATRASR
jgi:carboxypeptidase C (cathepsin A)